MPRTLDDMYQDLKLVREEEKSVLEVYKGIHDREMNLNDEITRYKLDNGMYQPILELVNHKGKTIEWIDLVERKEDGTLIKKSICYYQTHTKHLNIDENGHISWAYFDVTIDYDEEINRYIERHGNGKEIAHDYIGFLSLDFLELDKSLEGLSGEELIEAFWNK